MEKDAHTVGEIGHGSFKSYVIGFALSLLLTLTAYFLVTERLLHHWVLNAAIGLLSVLQVFFQLFFFLHMGEENKPRWNFIAFSFMVLVVGILVFGTMWIMYNLDYRMMTPMTKEVSG